MNIVRMASGARGRAEGQLGSMAAGNTIMVPPIAEIVQVQTQGFLHNSNCKTKRCPADLADSGRRALYGRPDGLEPRMKNCSLSIFASTATSKKPTIIS
jgi:hypothetical protein